MVHSSDQVRDPILEQLVQHLFMISTMLHIDQHLCVQEYTAAHIPTYRHCQIDPVA